ncbi:unnamed protein product [Prorocentrum cordatum]|uniref:Uncharacterized protein n=1 Tax=Prorocentrum cordatum TaxID=2364126 RepID=A0ABN9TEK4_9DINO|nr:unnamed protein product [Polarella glacialis]
MWTEVQEHAQRCRGNLCCPRPRGSPPKKTSLTDTSLHDLFAGCGVLPPAALLAPHRKRAVRDMDIDTCASEVACARSCCTSAALASGSTFSNTRDPAAHLSQTYKMKELCPVVTTAKEARKERLALQWHFELFNNKLSHLSELIGQKFAALDAQRAEPLK